MRGATFHDGQTVPPGLVFQSTHPVRGATNLQPPLWRTTEISIHAPREGCDGAWRVHAQRGGISIHAPREGCDGTFSNVGSAVTEFQSTHPVRGATFEALSNTQSDTISIHAPREGCDVREGDIFVAKDLFQSTHPVRGATDPYWTRWSGEAFQSTHPVRGATMPFMLIPSAVTEFQSTHPVRGATAGMDFASQDTDTPTTP